MATTSSSVTTPSPTLASLSPEQTHDGVTEFIERQQRNKAVNKFMARAEISMVTRALRARLSYASYKALHNVPRASLRELEEQSILQAQSSRNAIGKRKSIGGGSNYYNNPATQGGGLDRRAMAPPQSTTPGGLSKPQIQNIPPGPLVFGPGSDGYEGIMSAPSQSLFKSLLSPPPSKQARTIHNADHPPQQPSVRPSVPSTRSRLRNTPVRSIAESTRSQAKHRREEKAANAAKRKAKARTGKRKQKVVQKDNDKVDADGDVDMKAAAALTLLYQSRPSVSGSASSPQSSISSDSGSAPSQSQFTQTSSRVANSGALAPPPQHLGTTPTPSTSSARQVSVTPPPSAGTASARMTPLASGGPTDNEAADLMLFLATSPSPARPTTARDKNAQDLAAFRALSGGANLKEKGKVLFQGTGSDNAIGSSGVGVGGVTAVAPSREACGLTRNEGADSFASSVSSIGTEMQGVAERQLPLPAAPSAALTQPLLAQSSQTLAPPAPTSQLLPPSPLLRGGKYGNTLVGQSPTPGSGGGYAFNFNDFVNASPSPRSTPIPGSTLRNNLRADTGRKLFEEEQIRHHTQHASSSMQELGAGFDMVHS